MPANPIVDRTIAQLRKAKPSSINGLVTVEGLNVIKASVAPASIDRLERALGRIAATAEALAIKLVKRDALKALSGWGRADQVLPDL